MNREFLKFYNQELAILREQAAEFAQEYPASPSGSADCSRTTSIR